jgi:hypothetical protein
MKAEVYSWRVSTDLKTGLEREARRRNMSVSAVLDLAAREWLKKSGTENDNDDEQARLQDAAVKCFGAFEGGDVNRSKNAGADVRRILRRRYGR